MTSDQALTVGLFALLGGIGSLFFASRRPPASSWIATIVGWILGFHLFPPMLMGVALTIFAISK
jgi:hypothetical protein